MKSIKPISFSTPLLLAFLCLSTAPQALAIQDSVVAVPVEAAGAREILPAAEPMADLPPEAETARSEDELKTSSDVEMPPMPEPAQVQPAEASKGAPIEILPAKSVNTAEYNIDPDYETHPPMALTPDKSELVKLDEEAMTVIVGNPLHLSVLADSPKSLILVGRAPGATHFLALNDKGEVIMQRHVIVAAPKEKYVRIRSSCAGSGDGCQPTRVYYCPDMCHEVLINSQGETSTPPALPGPGGQHAVPGAAPAGQAEALPPSDEPS